jgi:hypothetical protein
LSLFALKKLEEFFIRVISEKGLGREIREMLISRVIDSIEVLKKDSTKLELLKFYLGCDDNRFPDGDLLFGYCHADLFGLVHCS